MPLLMEQTFRNKQTRPAFTFKLVETESLSWDSSQAATHGHFIKSYRIRLYAQALEVEFEYIMHEMRKFETK